MRPNDTSQPTPTEPTHPQPNENAQPTAQQPESERKVVVVTGASSGIGEALAERLVAEGHHVYAAARRLERLHALAERCAPSAARTGGSLRPVRLDVTDRADVAACVEGAVAECGRLDVFVNNAGVMPLSPLDRLLVEEWDRMLDVNVRGLLHGIAAALPHLTAGGGHFVTIASIGAHQVVPTSAVYSGTKYAAWAITEGLRQETDPSVRVTTVSPGVVTSELADSLTDPETIAAMRRYRAHAIGPEAVAGAVAYALAQPPEVDVNEIVVRPARQR